MSSKQSNECIQCGVPKSKYKCPKCYSKYCSVTCCKKHKEFCSSHVSIVGSKSTLITAPIEAHADNKEKRIAENKTEDDIEDKVPAEKLALLEQSDLLRKHLENPHLRQMLQKLDSTNDKTAGISQAMQEPIFTEFADTCLQIVDTEPDSRANIIKQDFKDLNL
ncbi:zinc finger HIT domain-containing protein 3-like [Antedon mediterranea]|uniref:zinc finger HIT domain-containing protein 3-like n=1 Tax=Antedon mediterranea TaxID=105859 RepID=UPI003AF79FE0